MVLVLIGTVLSWALFDPVMLLNRVDRLSQWGLIFHSCPFHWRVILTSLASVLTSISVTLSLINPFGSLTVTLSSACTDWFTITDKILVTASVNTRSLGLKVLFECCIIHTLLWYHRRLLVRRRIFYLSSAPLCWYCRHQIHLCRRPSHRHHRPPMVS